MRALGPARWALAALALRAARGEAPFNDAWVLIQTAANAGPAEGTVARNAESSIPREELLDAEEFTASFRSIGAQPDADSDSVSQACWPTCRMARRQADRQKAGKSHGAKEGEVESSLKSFGVSRGSNNVVLFVILGICYLCFALMVVFVYWQRGASVIASIVIYLISISFMTISVKIVFQNYNWRFPLLLTSIHLLLSAMLSFSVLFWRSRESGKAIVVPSLWELAGRIMPISICFGVSIGLNNTALVSVSPAIAEIIGSCTPVFSIPVTWGFGLHFHPWLMAPTAVVVLSAIMAVEPWGIRVELVGLILCLGSVLARAFKSVLMQEVLTGEMKTRFDPVALLAWTGTASGLEMLIWSFVSERSLPYPRLGREPGLWLAIILSSVNAVIANASMLFVTKELGAVGVQLVSQTKAVLIILSSVAFFDDVLRPLELIGFVGILAGAFWFNRLQEKLKNDNGVSSKGGVGARCLCCRW